LAKEIISTAAGEKLELGISQREACDEASSTAPVAKNITIKANG
jgi:hypothetical protein